MRIYETTTFLYGSIWSSNMIYSLYSKNTSADRAMASIVALVLFATPLNGQDFWASPISGNWTQASNWLDGSVPTILDDVSFTVIGAPYTVSIGNADAKSVTINSPDATVVVSTSGAVNQFNVDEDIRIDSGNLVAVSQYVINAQGGIMIDGGSLVPTNHSTLTAHNGVQNMPAGTINVRGVRSSLGTATFGARLFSSGDIDNSGLIKLETNRGSNGGVFSTLDVNGMLNNSGTIDSRPFEGFAAGGKTILADSLINSGTITNNDSVRLLFSRSGASYENSGTIDTGSDTVRFQSISTFDNLVSGQVIGTNVEFDSNSIFNAQITNAGQFDLSGNLQLNQIESFHNLGTIHSESGAISSGTSITTIINEGSISTGNDGTITFSAGGYTHRTGATISSPSLSITNSDIVLDNGFTTDSEFVNLFDSAITGAGIYQSQSGTNTSVTFLTVANSIAWENAGHVSLASTNTSIANFNGGFTNLTAGELTVRGIRNSTGSAAFGAQMNVVGDLNNEGTIGFETFRTGPNTFARLDVAGSVENSGMIESRPFEGTNTAGRSLNADLVNNSGAIVQNDIGTLSFSRFGADYVNTGEIVLNAGDIQFTNMNSFSNQGVISVDESSTLWLTGTSFSNEIGGTINAAGELRTGSGLSSFVDNGLLRPGSSPGTLTISNFNYQQSTDGVLEMEIAGLLPGIEHDQLVLTLGSGIFNGTLRLVFLDGYAPVQGDSFDLVTGNVTDNFQSIEVVGLAPNFEFDLTVSGGSLTLTALSDGVPFVLGDVNQDGLLNLLDVAPFVNAISSGTFQSEADTNQDGVLNLLDVAPFIELLSIG